jgi:hypothetical protein
MSPRLTLAALLLAVSVAAALAQVRARRLRRHRRKEAKELLRWEGEGGSTD